MADIPIPPIPPRRAPLIDIMRELEVRPRARQSSEFDPVAAMVAERRSQSRQPLRYPRLFGEVPQPEEWEAAAETGGSETGARPQGPPPGQILGIGVGVAALPIPA